MTNYIFKALAKADMTRDRADFLLHVDTDQGTIKLALNAGQLGLLMKTLHDIERSATTPNPAIGLARGETKQMQMEVVNRIQGGCGVVNNIQSMVIILSTAELSQAYAFDLQRTITLARIVARELKNLKTLASPISH